ACHPPSAARTRPLLIDPSIDYHTALATAFLWTEGCSAPDLLGLFDQPVAEHALGTVVAGSVPPKPPVREGPDTTSGAGAVGPGTDDPHRRRTASGGIPRVPGLRGSACPRSCCSSGSAWRSAPTARDGSTSRATRRHASSASSLW